MAVGTDEKPNFISVNPANFQFTNNSNPTANASSPYTIIGMNQNGMFENGVTFQEASVQKIFGNGAIINSNSNKNCDQILKMSKFYVKLTIKDTDTQKPIAEARAKSESTSSFEIANKNGIVVLGNVDSGVPNVLVAGPQNSTYINITTPVEIANMAKDTLEMEVFLEKGIAISGKVASGSNKIEGATVFVKGKEHITTLTDSNGNYKFGIPAGVFEIVAQKTGYLADEKQDDFVKGPSYKLDFNLGKPEFNAEKLMGYAMLLSDY
ncbi:carboxypeptidase-like regulatory domain-containing protein [Mariniflexile sp.]